MIPVRKRPVVVEAEQFLCSIPALTTSFNSGSSQDRSYTGQKFLNWPVLVDELGPYLIINTAGGHLRVAPGDWIIREAPATYTACAGEFFDKCYERVAAIT